MGDALCGPSNALHSFQKHTSADRSLQQDRRTLHQNYLHHGFRSAQGQSTGSLDSEFETFQAGFDVAPGPTHLRDLPGHDAHASFQLAASQPAWAADFQRLNISAPNQPAQSPSLSAQNTIPAANASSWHIDFLNQPTSIPPVQTTAAHHGPKLGTYTSAFHPARPFATMDPNITTSEGPHLVDDAAFDRAFEAAQADLLTLSSTPLARQEDFLIHTSIPEEVNPLMRMTWEKQPATYLVVKLWNAFGLSTDGTPFQQDTVQNASAFLYELELLQSQDQLTDEGEMLRTRKILRRILQLDQVPKDSQFQFTIRARRLLEKVEGNLAVKPERLEHQGKLPLESSRTISPSPNRLHGLPSKVIQQEEPLIPQETFKDDEELARTAAQLLDSVSDNTSKKFQESNFLALMRKLRDREVRVEGDRMVENLSSNESTEDYIARNEQDYDLGRATPAEPSWGDGYAGEPFA